MTILTTRRYMQYNSRITNALKTIEDCQNFIKSKQGFKKYADKYPERISNALFHLDAAKKSLMESNSAFFGGKIEIIVRWFLSCRQEISLKFSLSRISWWSSRGYRYRRKVRIFMTGVSFLTFKWIQDYYSSMLAGVIIAKDDLHRTSINFSIYSNIPKTAEADKIFL